MGTIRKREAYEALHAALADATRAADAVLAEALVGQEKAAARELTYAIRLVAVQAAELDVEGTRDSRNDRRDEWRRRQQARGIF